MLLQDDRLKELLTLREIYTKNKWKSLPMRII